MTPPLDRFQWEKLIRELDMPAPVKNVAAWLATYVNGSSGTNAHPGIQGLVKATGLSRATVIRSLSELESAGFIEAASRGGARGMERGMSTVYALSVPSAGKHGRHRGKVRLPAALANLVSHVDLV